MNSGFSSHVDNKDVRRILMVDEIISKLAHQLVCQQTHSERNDALRKAMRELFELRSSLVGDYIPF